MRLFFAIALPDHISAQLDLHMQGLPGARWVPMDMMHLTLRFIGNLDARSARDIAELLGQKTYPEITLQLSGLGYFGDRQRARVVWAGVDKNPELLRLQKYIETTLQRFGLEPEKRRFRPHVTLARFRDLPLDRLSPYLAAHGGLRSDPFEVASYILYSSHTVGGQPFYQPEYEFPLAAAPIPA